MNLNERYLVTGTYGYVGQFIGYSGVKYSVNVVIPVAQVFSPEKDDIWVPIFMRRFLQELAEIGAKEIESHPKFTELDTYYLQNDIRKLFTLLSHDITPLD